ncbi:MAG TPA: 16S rRNA methyltransferase [Thermoanaerobaculia bacterium]
MPLPAPPPDPAMEQVVAILRESRRYGTLHEPALRRLAAEALRIERGNVREAAKRAKRSLHQIFGAYLPQRPRYGRLLAALEAALATGDDEQVRRALRSAMGHHASTRERLPILDDFYREIFSRLGQPMSVIDVACGLNPLAVPWMGLPAGCRYVALDVDDELVAFVGACLQRLGVEGEARMCDALDEGVAMETDVALLLKSVPCLDQQRRGAGRAVIDGLSARRIVVSFPTRSIGGRSKGMLESYSTSFERLASGWSWERLEFPGELVYLVDKEGRR